MARILIVEDNLDIREMMKDHLEMEGHEIYEAENGKEGVDRALSLHPDLITMDMHMPIMNGHEAVETLRKHHGYTGKIIAVTASVMKSDTAINTESSYNGLISKPIGENFCALIEAFLEGDDQGQEI